MDGSLDHRSSASPSARNSDQVKKITVKPRCIPATTCGIIAALWAGSARADLESGVYHTLSEAVVEEWGDRVPNRSRLVPLFATFTFDLNLHPPAVTALITNAVLEGGNPFVLTVRS